MRWRIFDDPVWGRVGDIPLTETMLTSGVVTIVLLTVAVMARVSVQRTPSRVAAVLAVMFVEFCDDLASSITGQRHSIVANLAGSLFVFIGACNLAGQLPGGHPPTASLAATTALAVVVFVSVPVAGIWANGWLGYVRHYFRPNPLLMPLHVISELSRTVALSVRLFGNVMSGHLVVGLLVALTGILVPTPIMALDLLIGLLQAYIFTILAIVYIGAAMSAGEE